MDSLSRSFIFFYHCVFPLEIISSYYPALTYLTYAIRLFYVLSAAIISAQNLIFLFNALFFLQSLPLYLPLTI